MFMMAPITAASAIVLTPYLIETSADLKAKGSRGTLNHQCPTRCSKKWSAFKGEISDEIDHKILLVAV